MIPINLYLILVICVTARCRNLEEFKECGWDGYCDKKYPITIPSKYIRSNNSSSRCNCDPECVKYGDCCIDRAPFPRLKGKEVFSCVRLSVNETIYAVSNCMSGEEWGPLCEKDWYYSEEEYIQDIPVYSNLTGLHYANYYCALCDPILYDAWVNSTQSVVEIPAFTMKCSPNVTINMLRQHGEYQKGELVWKVGEGFCAFIKARKFKHGRPCVPSISSCPPGTDPEIAAKCDAYLLLITESNKVYRNPHCALCHGVKKSNMFCKYSHSDMILPSLAEIFSFDWSFNSCNFPENMRWDNFHKRCEAVNCPINGPCKVTMCQDKKCFHSIDNFSNMIEGYLTYVSFSISIICLLIHVYLTIFISPPKNLPSKVVNSLAWSLLIAQTLFLCGTYSLVFFPYTICYSVAIIIQFFFLASFLWMNVISFDIFYTFSDSTLKNYSTKSYTKYAMWSWGGAALITAVSVAADFTTFIPDRYRPQYSARQNICWFGNWLGMGIFFYFPILIINAVNVALFVITICMFRRMECNAQKINKSGRKEYNRLLMYIKLSTMMGIMWAVSILTSNYHKSNFRFPFTVLNGLQGAFIFIMFDLKIAFIFNYFENIALRFLSGFIKRNRKSALKSGNDFAEISRTTDSSSIVSEGAK